MVMATDMAMGTRRMERRVSSRDRIARAITASVRRDTFTVESTEDMVRPYMNNNAVCFFGFHQLCFVILK